jgi:type VI protein secretion system component VasK
VTRIQLHWLVFVIAILLAVLSIAFALYAPHEPDSSRGLQLVLTATGIAWIMWGQMVHANRRARSDADDYLRLIAQGDVTQFRRRAR